MQPVALFHVTGDTLAAAEEVVLVQPLALLVHVQRHDVQVVAVDVLMFIDHIRLVAVAELLHVLVCEVFQFHVRELVIGMRIEGDVDNGVACTHVGGHTVPEVVRRPAYVHLSRTRVKNSVGGKELAFVLVNLLAVVGERPVKGVAYTDFCDHRSSNFWVSAMIWRLNSTSSIVCFSSL